MEVRTSPLAFTPEGPEPTPSGGRCNEFTRVLVRQRHRCASVRVSPHMLQEFHGTGVTS